MRFGGGWKAGTAFSTHQHDSTHQSGGGIHRPPVHTTAFLTSHFLPLRPMHLGRVAELLRPHHHTRRAAGGAYAPWGEIIGGSGGQETGHVITHVLACSADAACPPVHFRRPAFRGTPDAHAPGGLRPGGLPQTLKQACSRKVSESAMCVQRFDDSLSSAIHITYRISLRSSSLQ